MVDLEVLVYLKYKEFHTKNISNQQLVLRLQEKMAEYRYASDSDKESPLFLQIFVVFSSKNVK